MKKKIVFISLLCAVSLMLLCGCGQKKYITIKFSSWGSESEISAIKPLLKEFEAQNPDIKVEFWHIPKNYFQKLHLLAASNLMPDVVFVNNLSGMLFAKNNLFLDLKNSISEQNSSINENNFYKESLQAVTYQKSLYAIPRDISNLVIYYNKDVFDKYDIPYPRNDWDFNDFLATCLKFKNKNIFAISFEEAPLFWTPFLWSNGGGILSEDGEKEILTDENSIKSLQFYADLRNKYHVAPTASEAGSATMAQLFLQQKLAMHISGRWSVPKYRKDADFNWDIAKFPRGNRGSVVDCDVSGWAISSSSQHPKEAWKLIEFLASEKSISAMAKSGLIVPARKDVAASQEFLAPKSMPANSKLFTEIISTSMPTPVTSNYQEITDFIKTSFEPLWNGEKTAKEVTNKEFKNKLNRLSELDSSLRR